MITTKTSSYLKIFFFIKLIIDLIYFNLTYFIKLTQFIMTLHVINNIIIV
jgi:hypothetical protein